MLYVKMANSADPDQTRTSPIRGAVSLEELSGSGCSNLTMSLVNERLEFQTTVKTLYIGMPKNNYFSSCPNTYKPLK